MDPAVTAIFVLIYLLTVLLSATKAVPMSIAALSGALLTAWFGLQYEVFPTYGDMFSVLESSLPLLSLIIGTMIVVEVAGKSGLFRFGALYAVKISKGKPVRLFVSLCVISAIVSMFLSDPTAMLLMAAAIVTISKLLDYDPVPYFLSATIMINLGGTSTLIGSTSNMVIGLAAGEQMSFTAFIGYLLACELALWALTIFVLYTVFKSRLGKEKPLPEYSPWQSVKNKKQFYRSILVLLLLLTLFLASDSLPNVRPEAIALGCAVLALIFYGKDPSEIFRGIDWETVFFIAGFMFVVGGIERTGLLNGLSSVLVSVAGDNPVTAAITILWFSGVASAIVSNVAIALTFIPIVISTPSLSNPAVWSGLVLGTNLGGATTPLSGSVVIMAAGTLKQEGISMSFREFAKIGILTSLVQLAFSSLYLLARFGLGGI